MWSIIKEFLVYVSFLWLLYFLSYSNRNHDGFYQVNHLRKFLLEIGNQTHDYTKVTHLDENRIYRDRKSVV